MKPPSLIDMWSVHSNEKAKCDLFVCWRKLWQLPTDFEHACVRPGTHARKFLELLVSNRVKRNTLKSNRFWAKPDIERYQRIVLGPPKPDIEPVLLWPDDRYTYHVHRKCFWQFIKIYTKCTMTPCGETYLSQRPPVGLWSCLEVPYSKPICECNVLYFAISMK